LSVAATEEKRLKKEKNKYFEIKVYIVLKGKPDERFYLISKNIHNRPVKDHKTGLQ
jgi:hypothetical protein